MTVKRRHRKPYTGFSEQEINAIMARATQMVGCLRNRWVCWGWRLDDNRARKFLGDLRMTLSAKSYDVEYQEAAHKWLFDHGQSLDWLLTATQVA